MSDRILVALDIALQPNRERLRTVPNVAPQLVKFDGREFGDLSGIRRSWCIRNTEKEMDELILDHVIVELGPIAGAKALLQPTDKPGFLSQAPLACGNHRFARTGVSAGRIRPFATRMIFAGRAPLQAKLAIGGKDKDRKGTMKPASAMGFELVPDSKLDIVLVNKNKGFFALRIRGRGHEHSFRAGRSRGLSPKNDTRSNAPDLTVCFLASGVPGR